MPAPGAGEGILGTQPSPNLAVTDAVVMVNGVQAKYDPDKEAYQIPATNDQLLHITGKGPGIRDFEKTLVASLFRNSPVELTVASREDLVVQQQGQLEIFSDPRTWQSDASNLSTPPQGNASEFIRLRGAVGGIIMFGAADKFQKWASENGIRVHAVMDSYFFFAPEHGSDWQTWGGKVITDLKSRDWVVSCGPLLYANKVGFGYLLQSIYLETANAMIDQSTAASITAHASVRGLRPVKGRVGTWVDTDPGLGFGIIDLAEKLQQVAGVKDVEVQIERITTELPLDTQSPR